MAEHEENAGPEAGRAAGPDTAAAAVSVALGARGAGVNAEAAGFLRDQRRLVNLQIANLEETQALHHRHLALKYFGDRLRIGLQLLAIAFGVVIVAALGAAVWEAVNDHGLVIEAFSVPPALAQDGLTGQVVAARFLDKLQGLEAATESVRPAASYKNNWGSDIKVEIPETGITFAEFERLLRDKLGRSTQVTGEVVRTARGIALTARFGDQPPQTFQGAEADLDALAEKAAEDVYRVSQPYRYAEYLSQHARLPEAAAAASELAANGPTGERAWADSLLAKLDIGRGDLVAARAHIDQGLAAGGDGVEWVKIMRATVEAWSGHDEALLAISLSLDRKDTRKRLAQVTEASFEENRLVSSAYLAGQLGDYAKSATDYGALVRGLGSGFYRAQAADVLALDHDDAAAARLLSLAGRPQDVDFYVKEGVDGWYALPTYQVAAAQGDWPKALAEVRTVEAMIEAQKGSHPVLGLMEPVLVRPLEALALARTSDLAAAEALIGSTPRDCYLCIRVRAEIAAAKGDRNTADHWFAEAVRQAPSIPFAYAEWADARLARGDSAGAIALYRIAHAKGPHFADPLKGWGDALARQGRSSEAIAKYDEALKDAPAWAALRQARAAAAREG